MIEWVILFLMILLWYLSIREGFIEITDNTPVDSTKAFIQKDLDSLNGKRLIYIVYTPQANVNTIIETKIKQLRLEPQYSILRIFPVKNTVFATSLFSHFYHAQIDYNEVTVLTNNVNSTQKNNTQLMTFINTDTPFYVDLMNIMVTYNKAV
jgi:hypothetical protein